VNEVRDMIGKALRDEPPVRVDYDTVLAAGRRRRARRQFGIVGAAALGVAAVVSVAVLVGQRAPSPAITPATSAAPPTTGTGIAQPSPDGGCSVPRYTGGFTDPPTGASSTEELAESARLTAALGRFDFPLPAGVTMDPAKPKLCAIKNSWGVDAMLRAPGSERTVILEIKPRRGAPALPCRERESTKCDVRTLADGTNLQIILQGTQPTIVTVIAWRPDDTIVRVMETGSGTPSSAKRILDTDALIKIASAPQLKTEWHGPASPPEASGARAATLTESALKSDPVRGNRVPIPGSAFRVSQGGYKFSLDLSDSAGVGNLFINLNAPAGDKPVSCENQAGCETITLPDKRNATVTRQADGGIQRLMLNTLAADGTQVFIMTTNQSDKSASQGKSAPTRPTPPLSVDDLIKIAGESWLHW